MVLVKSNRSQLFILLQQASYWLSLSRVRGDCLKAVVLNWYRKCWTINYLIISLLAMWCLNYISFEDKGIVQWLLLSGSHGRRIFCFILANCINSVLWSGLDICRKNLPSPPVSHTIFKSYWSSRKKKPKLKGLKKKNNILYFPRDEELVSGEMEPQGCVPFPETWVWALASATNLKWAACLCAQFVLFKLACLHGLGGSPFHAVKGAHDRILMDYLKTNGSFLLSGLNLWHESQMSV